MPANLHVPSNSNSSQRAVLAGSSRLQLRVSVLYSNSVVFVKTSTSMDTKKAMKANRTLTLSLLLIMLIAGETQGEITCTAVTTRIATNVTCDFGLDINKIKRNFNVEFYHPNLNAQPETPVACNFKLDGDLICREGSDVTFDRVVSSQIRFSRPPSVDKVGGQYVCHPVPSLDNTPVQPCSLTYKEIPTTSQPPPPTTPPPPPPTTTRSSKPIPHANDGLQRSLNTIIMLTAVTVILLVVIVLTCAVLLVTLYRRRYKLKKWWKDPQLDPSWLDERTIPEPSPINHTGQLHVMVKETPCSLPTDVYSQGREGGLNTGDNVKEDDKGNELSTEPSEVTKDKEEAKKDKKKSSVFKKLRRSKRGKGSARSEEDKDEDDATPEEAPLQSKENMPLTTQPEESMLSRPQTEDDIPLRQPEAVTKVLPLSYQPSRYYTGSGLSRTTSATAADYCYRPSLVYSGNWRR